jgi:hypothetical protein
MRSDIGPASAPSNLSSTPQASPTALSGKLRAAPCRVHAQRRQHCLVLVQAVDSPEVRPVFKQPCKMSTVVEQLTQSCTEAEGAVSEGVASKSRAPGEAVRVQKPY